MSAPFLLKKLILLLLTGKIARSAPKHPNETNASLRDSYINLLKKSLLNDLYIELETTLLHTLMETIYSAPLSLKDFTDPKKLRPDLVAQLETIKRTGDTITLSRPDASGGIVYDTALRNYSEWSHTMIGRARLENIQFCVETVLAESIPGDFIETGIWRGGACIFIRGMLKAYGINDRIIWAADSFEGVPPPSLPEDADFDISKDFLPILAVSLDEVRSLFKRYELLDDQTRFLKGWFKDTLHVAPIEKLAILRLDGDLYESTMDALKPLYDKVSPGGFIIVDDYYSCPPCAKAITDFRASRGIAEPMIRIDNQSLYWRKAH